MRTEAWKSVSGGGGGFWGKKRRSNIERQVGLGIFRTVSRAVKAVATLNIKLTPSIVGSDLKGHAPCKIWELMHLTGRSVTGQESLQRKSLFWPNELSNPVKRETIVANFDGSSDFRLWYKSDKWRRSFLWLLVQFGLVRPIFAMLRSSHRTQVTRLGISETGCAVLASLFKICFSVPWITNRWKGNGKPLYFPKKSL